ncbi:Atu4866 domain-containing protein [Pseudoxanthomonas sp. PXM02]|uniref:Atu4866 domain-containing protein n=1 Tax=Pseudoxanthomonas sp. PXM02 TaxID=2769294 RepID=UPI0031F2DFCB
MTSRSPDTLRRRALGAALAPTLLAATSLGATESGTPAAAPHPYVGMWVTDDGRVRHELLPNGRYDEARGRRESAYQGRYTVTGNHIDYVDDTGFIADGEFIDGVLYHGGMVLRRAAVPKRADTLRDTD